MFILQIPLLHLNLLYHVVYDNKSGNILSLKIFENNSSNVLNELHIETDYTIEYYMNVYAEMLNYIKKRLSSNTLID